MPRLLRQTRAVVALEFAILSVPFVLLLLGVMEAGYDLLVQEALDSAMETAARSVQVGSTTGTAGETSQKIVAAVCPNLSTLLNCNYMIVGVVQVPQNYYSSPIPSLVTYASASSAKGGGVCTGVGGNLMGLAAWYNGPTFLGPLVPGFAIPNPGSGGGGLVHQTYAQVAFVNEYFSGGQACS